MVRIKKTPSVRFKGFEEDWEDKTVADILTERNEQFPKSEEYPLMAFVANIGVTSKGDRYNREFLVTDEDNKKYKRTELGDFIYSSNNLETGSIGLNNHGNASISPVYSIFKPNEIANSNFIGRLLSRKEFINKMIRWRQGVVYGQWKIHEHNFIKIDIITTSPAEQVQIGNYFKEIDGLIQLQEQTLEKVTNLKLAMLEKMFPKENFDMPEIRFKGFVGKWEKKKLEEVADFNPKSELPSRFEYVDLESVVGTKMINHRTEMKNTAPSRAQRLAKKGDLFYQTVRPYQKNNYLFELPFRNYVFSTGYAQLRPRIDGRLLLNIVQSKSFIKDVLRNCTGTSYPAISSTDLALIEISVPPNEDEQQKIGAYFQSLDQLIIISGEKIEKLRNLKQALLQKMFI